MNAILKVMIAVFGVEVNVPKADPANVSLSSILGWVYFAVAAVAVIIIIVAGIQYMTSQGEPEKTKKAQATITYAVIGLVIASAAAAIIGFVTGAFS